MKTTYERARDAFLNFSKGFVPGKLLLKEHIKVNKIFSKIKDIAGEIEKAEQQKINALNEKILDEGIKDEKIISRLTNELGKELLEVKSNLVLDLTDEEIGLVKRVIEEISWKEEERPNSSTLVNITNFLEDLSTK